MDFLPGFFVALVLLGVCSGGEKEPVSRLAAIDNQSPKCPGECQEAGSCVTSLSETDCTEGLICCVDSLEKVAATEFEDSDFTTESILDSNLVQEVEEIADDGSDEFTEASEEADLFERDELQEETSDGGEIEVVDFGEGIVVEDGVRYRLTYSEETGETVLAPVSKYDDDSCPGTCVSAELQGDCSYVMPHVKTCPSDSICCLSEEDYARGQYVDYEDKPSSFVKRSTDHMPSNCPGTCVHPMHSSHCQTLLTQFSCPLNTKCCILSNTQKASVPETTECTGMCVPFRMIGYCLPPNELVMGPSTCPSGQTCCMMNPSNIQPPQFSGMAYPSSQPSSEYSADILGHLAVDEVGTVFKVSNRGQVSPLPRLPPTSNYKDFVKMATYPRPDGELVIFSDEMGTLYQEFYPRLSLTSESKNPLHRQPIQQFESQASQHSASFQSSTDKDKFAEPDANSETLSDIVIPDEDDDAPVTTNSPVAHGDKSSRPQCPGSCMSYFLRFTCFRGYAIYDGFTCPGRSVCCARLKDIEDHEQYLKSLSPYFNVPPASRDSTLPRCGIKGRRDTPRIMGGKDSLPGEWCWQVAVINVQNQYICGGALIDNSWVLTAAHCVVGPMEEGQALFIRAGVTDLKSPDDNSKAQTVRVLSTFVHHNFNSLNLDNNIALLRLQKPVDLGSNVCVVCLPTNRKMPLDGTKCTVTGYGFISADGGMSLRIREAQVPIIDDMECMTNVTEALDNPFILPSSSFCAGGEGLADACQGDAGGALACEVGGFHELVGLVSWGLGCGRNDVPSIYVKVPAFMGWINQIISSSSFIIP